MTTKRRFIPNISIVGKVNPTYSIQELESVNSFYAASPNFAIRHGGKIISDILKSVPESYFKECKDKKLLPNIDVRVHRLYPGIYPAFPGWHCDGEFRETYFSQPDLDKTPVSKTVVCTVSSHKDGVSNTEFLEEEFEAEIKTGEPEEFKLWKQVHEQIVNSGPKKTWLAPDGNITMFSNDTIHRATPAKIRGWRLFFRMSMWHKPYLGEEGKLSKQEQVYQVLESNGW